MCPQIFFKKESILGWAWWFIYIILALWEAEGGRSPEVKSSRPNQPTWRNPNSTKNQKKLARHGVICL